MAFWGLILQPGKRYSKTIEQPFHLSMAALDLNNSNQKSVQVTLAKDKKTYLLCTLSAKKDIIQCSLDINCMRGEEITFSVNGEGTVHLTGYLIDDYDDEGDEDGDMLFGESNNTLSSTNDESDEGSEDEEEDEGDDNKSNSDGSDEDESEDEESVEEEEVEEEEPPKKQKKTHKNEANKPAQQNGQVSSNKNKKNETKVKKEQEKKPNDDKSQVKVVEGGVKIKDTKVGTGPVAKSGKFVGVYYDGRLKSTNKKFDDHLKGTPFKFRLGNNEVIKGWEVGLIGMRVGGKRRITCPPNMAYGAKGAAPTIPPNSTLVFDVELKMVQ